MFIVKWNSKVRVQDYVMWTCDPVRVITRLIAGLDIPYAANFLYLFYIHPYSLYVSTCVNPFTYHLQIFYEISQQRVAEICEKSWKQYFTDYT